MGISRPRQFSLQSMLCSTDAADPLEEFSEFNIPLKQSYHILTISEPPFAPSTNVGSDGDLFLFLTFCQNYFLVLSACSAAAKPSALCISAFLRHCRNDYLKSFFVLVMFLYMSPVLGLLQFTRIRKAAFAIWCFDLTTEFQPGMLNLSSFSLPVFLIAEDAAASRALVSSAYKFSISSRCFSSVQFKFWQCLTSVGTCS